MKLIVGCIVIALGVVLTDGLVSVGTAQVATPDPPRTYTYRETGGQALRAFVFASRKNHAQTRPNAILLFHGGGWSAGAPDWTFEAARRFADAGLVAIAVQYRLSEGTVTPIDALEDVCAAFEWARRQSTDLGISGRVAGYGVSAGGHLLAATVTVGCPSDSRAARAGPEALLLWSPALDVSEDRWFLKKLQGRATAAAYSPAGHVRASTPPTSIVHGDKDTLTPLAGARRYCDRLTALGGLCELNIYAGVGHLLTRNLANQESDFDPDPSARADGIAKHLLFLKKLGFVARQ
jgi:acetyl esterase